MTINVFLVLLTAFSIITSLFTEAVKTFLDSLNLKYASNIVALYCAMLVGGLGMMIFYVFTDAEVTMANSICIFLMMFANWLVAMLGYDKVKQAIMQLKGGGIDG